MTSQRPKRTGQVFTAVAPHQRQYRSGKRVHVRGHVRSWLAKKKAVDGGVKHSKCPSCGAQIDMRRLPGGRVLGYEIGKGLQWTVHHCFSLGQGMRSGKCVNTNSIFDHFGVATVHMTRKRKAIPARAETSVPAKPKALRDLFD